MLSPSAGMTRIPRFVLAGDTVLAGDKSCFHLSGGIRSKSVGHTELTPESGNRLTVKGNGMRRLGNSLASACRVRNLICIALVGVSVWAAGIGLLPIGPRASVA